METAAGASGPGSQAAPVGEAEGNGAVQKRDRVTHKGKIWRSLEDRNTREPGEYGWEELV